MDGDVGAEVFDNPGRHFLQFGVRIVLSRNQQVGEFEPDVGFVGQVLQCFEHRRQAATADLVIELFGEGLQVDVGGIHGFEEFVSWLRTDLSCCHRHCADPKFVAGVGDVDGVLQKDDGIVVGEGDARTSEVVGRSGDRLGGGGICEGVDFAGFADVPVLAEMAGEVAARCAEGQDRCAWQEVVQWFLFNGIDAETTRTAIRGQHHLRANSGADETESTLAVTQPAETWTEVALQASVLQGVPVTARYRRSFLPPCAHSGTLRTGELAAKHHFWETGP